MTDYAKLDPKKFTRQYRNITILFTLVILVAVAAFLIFGIGILGSIVTRIIYEKDSMQTLSMDRQTGIASWYDYKLQEELVWTDDVGVVELIGVPCFRSVEDCYTLDKDFAASRWFERGDILLVTNAANGKKVEVTVTDFIEHPDRVIDLTSHAFQQLAPLVWGLIDVNIRKIGVTEL